MGAVFAGFDDTLRRKAALKTIHSDVALQLMNPATVDIETGEAEELDRRAATIWARYE